MAAVLLEWVASLDLSRPHAPEGAELAATPTPWPAATPAAATAVVRAAAAADAARAEVAIERAFANG